MRDGESKGKGSCVEFFCPKVLNVRSLEKRNGTLASLIQMRSDREELH